MHKYLTLILLPSMLLLASCGLVDEYLDSSETPENSQEIEGSVSSNNEDTDESEAKEMKVIQRKKIMKLRWKKR